MFFFLSSLHVYSPLLAPPLTGLGDGMSRQRARMKSGRLMRPARSKGSHLSDHRAATRSPGEALKLPIGPRPLRPRRTVGLGHLEACNRSRESDETGDGAARWPPMG